MDHSPDILFICTDQQSRTARCRRDLLDADASHGPACIAGRTLHRSILQRAGLWSLKSMSAHRSNVP